MADGYGFWWKGRYWASLSTGGKPADGRHDVYFGPVPADTHGHVWVKFPPSTEEPTMGASLKDSGKHVGSPAQGSFSTQPVLRGRVSWNAVDGTVTTEIAQLDAPSTYTAAPVTSNRTQSRRAPGRVDLGVPNEATWFEFDVALTGNRSSASSSTSQLLPFGGSSPLAVRISITRWG